MSSRSQRTRSKSGYVRRSSSPQKTLRTAECETESHGKSNHRDVQKNHRFSSKRNLSSDQVSISVWIYCCFSQTPNRLKSLLFIELIGLNQIARTVWIKLNRLALIQANVRIGAAVLTKMEVFVRIIQKTGVLAKEFQKKMTVFARVFRRMTIVSVDVFRKTTIVFARVFRKEAEVLANLETRTDV